MSNAEDSDSDGVEFVVGWNANEERVENVVSVNTGGNAVDPHRSNEAGGNDSDSNGSDVWALNNRGGRMNASLPFTFEQNNIAQHSDGAGEVDLLGDDDDGGDSDASVSLLEVFERGMENRTESNQTAQEQAGTSTTVVTSVPLSHQHPTTSTIEGQVSAANPVSSQPVTAFLTEQDVAALNNRRGRRNALVPSTNQNDNEDAQSDVSGDATTEPFETPVSPQSSTSTYIEEDEPPAVQPALPQPSTSRFMENAQSSTAVQQDSSRMSILANTEQQGPSSINVVSPRPSASTNIEETTRTVVLSPQQPSTSTATKRKHSSPNASSKKSRDSLGSQDSDSDSCTICFEPWTNSGKHKLCCLKCGHLFGESCILRWLKTAKKCPQCNTPARKNDVRVLYARKLQAQDTTELTEATKLYENASKSCREKEMELAKVRMQYQMAMAEVERLMSKMKEMKDSQVASSTQNSTQPSSSSSRKFLPVRTVLIANDGGCRILDFHKESQSIAISFPSPHPRLAPGFSLRKLSLSDGRTYQWGVVHKKMIKDFKISPCNKMVLSASQDKTLRITNWDNLLQMHSYDVTQPVWSCCWDMENANLLYAGLNNGQINCYDIRFTAEPVHKIINSDSRCPVVTLYHILRGENSSTPGGLLAHNFQGVMFWNKESDVHYIPHMLPLPPGNCAGLRYSHTQKQCLVTYRQGRSYSHCTQTVCDLTIGPSSDISADIVANFHGGLTHKMLARHAIFSTPTDGNVIAFGDEANKSVQLYEAKAGGRQLQTLYCGNPTLDILPIATEDKTLLAALTDKEIKLFEHK